MIALRTTVLLFLFGILVACGSTSSLSATTPRDSSRGLSYRVVLRDQTGKIRLVRDYEGHSRPAEVAEPGDVKVFIFGIHVDSLHRLGEDDVLAARTLLESTNSIPKECAGKYSVTEIGRLEGGLRTISVECDPAQ